VDLPPRKISSFLQLVKDELGLKTTGIYSICCECSQVYTGQVGRSIDTRLKEHQQHIHLEHLEKSAVMEHSINFGHRIHIHHTAILSTKHRCMAHIIREATENELHPNNMNREDSFCLSKSWKPLICSLKDHREPSSHDSISGFSVRQSRSVHTALIRAQNMPSSSTLQRPP
jgi:hypothetical protein